MDTLSFLTRNVELATAQDTGNLNAKFVLCDFSVNGNGVSLNRATVENWMPTLINQPLVGRVGYGGDFTGHNVGVSTITDAEGKQKKVVTFNTEAIGVFKEVAIETIDNDECIVGSAEIWARYPLVCELIKKRVADGTLHTSWEISVSESHMDGETKVIDNGAFTALCVLGKNVAPAYEVSRALEVAESYEDTELSEALLNDISYNQKREEQPMEMDQVIVSEEETTETVEQAETITEDVADNPITSESEENAEESECKDDDEEKAELEEEAEVESASLTARDLRRAIEKALCERNCDGYVEYMFPEEHYVFVRCYGRDRKELEYSKFAYTVNGDSVELGEPEDIELVASPLHINEVVAEKDNAISDAANTIAELNQKIAELTPYKEAADLAAAEKEAAEKAQKVEALKSYASKSGFITESELTEGDIATMISELNESGIKQIIAERFMNSLNEKNTVEVASKNEIGASKNLYDGDSDNVEVDLVSAYINHK